MSEENIRELLGRYATGALTKQERAQLFEAALEDDGMFEELAQEHEFKALLEQPGAKERMLASLTPGARERSRGWAWAGRITAVAATVAVIAIAIFWEPPARQIREGRKFIPPPVSVPPIPVIQSTPPELTASTQSNPLPVLPSVPAIAGVPAPPFQTAAAESVRRLASVPKGVAPQPPPAIAAAGFRADNRFVGAAPPNAFAFNYSLLQNGKLQVIPAARGFLTVTVGSGAESRSFADNLAVQPEAVSEFDIPSDTSLVTVVFSAQRISPGDLKPESGGAMDSPSGLKFDPNPSAASRLTAIIPITSARR